MYLIISSHVYRIFEVIGKVWWDWKGESRTISWDDARATNGSRSRISAKITRPVNWFREYGGSVACACARGRRRRMVEERKEGRKRRKEGGTQRASRSFASESMANPCNRFVTTQRLPFFLSTPLAYPPFSVEKNWDPVGEGLAADTHSPILGGEETGGEKQSAVRRVAFACFPVSHGNNIGTNDELENWNVFSVSLYFFLVKHFSSGEISGEFASWRIP